jgi:hypothetical protein
MDSPRQAKPVRVERARAVAEEGRIFARCDAWRNAEIRFAEPLVPKNGI